MISDKQYRIRALRPDETEVLKAFLYEAIFVPEGEISPPKSIIEKPELRVYTDDFGTKRDDNCLVAETEDEQVIGAVWCRIMNDYGHVDDETPSLAVSLYKEYRNRGIGTDLMREMLALLRDKGYVRVSLSVQKANYAVKLYKKMGFEAIEDKDGEYIMVCELQKG